MRETDKKLAQALGNEANKYMSLNASVVPKHYAPQSKFYEQVMEDGYVFNPFIHRRWLPSQYKKITRFAQHNGYTIDQRIRSIYTYAYSVEFCVSEVDKLLTLQRHDPDAYDERSKFFTFDILKEILSEYINVVIDNLSTSYGTLYCYVLKNRGNELRQYGEQVEQLVQYGNNFRNAVRISYEPLKTRLNEVKRQLEKARSLYDLKRAMRTCPEAFNVNASHGRRLNDNFVEAFWRSGAYYSIKNEVMFAGATLESEKGAFACRKLQDMIDKPASELHQVYLSIARL